MNTRSSADLAAMLGTSIDYVRREARARRIPHLRIARQIRFTDEQVEAIIAAHAVEVVDTPPEPTPRPPRRRRPDTYVRTQP